MSLSFKQISVFVLLLTAVLTLKGARERKQQQQTLTWGYEDLNAGDWALGDCAVNDRPSPVNLIVEDGYNFACSPKDGLTIQPNNDPIQTTLANNGLALRADGVWETIKVKDDGESLIYNAEQFHFHAPAEHTINGQTFDLELHIVHKIDKKYAKHGEQYVVIGYFFNLDDKYNPIFDQIDPNQSCTYNSCPELVVNFSTLDLRVNEYLQYYGSLTTPPCAPLVNWFLNPEVQSISREQLLGFQNHWNANKQFAKNFEKHGDHQHKYVGNNRPIQGEVIPWQFKAKC